MVDKKKIKRGRPRGTKKQNLIILEYRYWIIEIEESFPSVNYIVRKTGNGHCAYCTTITSALWTVYNSMILSNIKENHNYGRKIEDLCNVIIQTKNEFALLVSTNEIIKNSYKIIEKQTAHGEGDSSC